MKWKCLCRFFSTILQPNKDIKVNFYYGWTPIDNLFFAFMKEVVTQLQTDSHQSSKCDKIVFTSFKTILASWKFDIFDDRHTYHQFLPLLY